MPSGSSIQQFVDDLKTGTSKITRALDRLFTNPGQHAEHDHFPWLSSGPGALNKPLPPPVKTFLTNGPPGGLGLGNTEVDHIDDWPGDQKELVRKALVSAIQNNRNSVHFFWELYDGDHEDTVIVDPDAGGDITITFRSPRKNVVLEPGAAGNVSVDVG